MVSFANYGHQFMPQFDNSMSILPQLLIHTFEAINSVKNSNEMSSTSASTPPLTILEPATPPQSQPEDLRTPSATAAASAATVPRLTDFSIAAILGNSIGAISTPSPAFCNQTFTTSLPISPVANSNYSDTSLHIATNLEHGGTNNNQSINHQDNNKQQQQQQQHQQQQQQQQQHQKHVSSKRVRPKKYQCPYCWVALSNTGQFKGHIRIHTGERPFICECGKSFTRNEELTRHKRIHTGLRPYSCTICNKSFGRKDHLKKHTRTHEKGGSGVGGGSGTDDKLDESSAFFPQTPNAHAVGLGNMYVCNLLHQYAQQNKQVT